MPYFHAMTLEELRVIARNAARQPIAIRLTDGRSLVVAHPEFLGLPHDGESFMYFPDSGGWQMLFLDQVVSVDSVNVAA